MMGRKRKSKYSFSKFNEGQTIGFVVSKELNDRIAILCNLTEMNKTALCRYLLKKGITELENRLMIMAKDREDKGLLEQKSG